MFLGMKNAAVELLLQGNRENLLIKLLMEYHHPKELLKFENLMD
jgi:hypothetical protein